MKERIESKNTKTSLCKRCPRHVKQRTKDGLCYFCMLKVHGKPIDIFASGSSKSGAQKNR